MGNIFLNSKSFFSSSSWLSDFIFSFSSSLLHQNITNQTHRFSLFSLLIQISLFRETEEGTLLFAGSLNSLCAPFFHGFLNKKDFQMNKKSSPMATLILFFHYSYHHRSSNLTFQLKLIAVADPSRHIILFGFS